MKTKNIVGTTILSRYNYINSPLKALFRALYHFEQQVASATNSLKMNSPSISEANLYQQKAEYHQ